VLEIAIGILAAGRVADGHNDVASCRAGHGRAATATTVYGGESQKSRHTADQTQPNKMVFPRTA